MDDKEIMEFYLTPNGGDRFQLPVNPSEVRVQREKNYEKINIINLGEMDFPHGEKVREISFSSFFPREYDPSYCKYPDLPDPQKAMNMLTSWTVGRTPVRLFITNTEINVMVLISVHNTTIKGGEPGDVYYDLSCRTWREPNLRGSADIPGGGDASSLNNRPGSRPQVKEYKVKPGDCLYSIAKSQLGSGSRWVEIYANEENKKTIGSNPDLIYPGQRLVIPS